MGFLAKNENAGDRALKSQNSAAFGVQSDDCVLVHGGPAEAHRQGLAHLTRGKVGSEIRRTHAFTVTAGTRTASY
jgi:hypothetical protein